MKKIIKESQLNKLIEERVNEILEEGMFDSYTTDDQERLLSSLVLVAENDGDAYRNNKNALQAVESAFKDHLRDTIRGLKSDYKRIAHSAIQKVMNKWTEETGMSDAEDETEPVNPKAWSGDTGLDFYK